MPAGRAAAEVPVAVPVPDLAAEGVPVAGLPGAVDALAVAPIVIVSTAGSALLVAPVAAADGGVPAGFGGVPAGLAAGG